MYHLSLEISPPLFYHGTQFSINACQRRQANLLKRRGNAGQNHPDPVATTWSLSFEKIEQSSELAADLLRVCAFLAPDAIPVEMFIEGATEFGPQLEVPVDDLTLLDEAIGELLRFSLVKRDKEDSTLSIHRLVQAVLKANMNEEMQREWAERVVRAVSEAFPNANEVENWPQCKQLVPQAQVCAELISDYGFEFTEAAGLFNEAGYYLMEYARYEEAELLLKRTLTINEKVLGPEHPGTSMSLNNLASLYDKQGRYEEAKPLYQRTLTIYERMWGPEHPEVALSLNNLAELYRRQGKYKEAESFYQRALTIKEKVLGPEHLSTATSLNNLALLYDDQGKYVEAESLYQRALAIVEKVLGLQHPNTVKSLNNLAKLYQHQGRYKDAKTLGERALHICEKVLGPEHPETATILNNLAEMHRVQGKYEEAKILYECALQILMKVLGPKHSNTLTVMRNYMDLLEKMGLLEDFLQLVQLVQNMEGETE